MDNVLDIIFNFSKKGIFIDKEGLEKIIHLLIKELNIELMDPKEDVHIFMGGLYSKKDPNLASYLNGELEIFLGKTYDYIRRESETIYIDMRTLSRFEKTLIDNIFIVSNALHELMHALQDQLRILNKTHTTEQTLINVELAYIDEMNSYYDDNRGLYIDMRKIYEIHYDRSFVERLADIDAQEYIIKLLDKVKKEISKVYELQKILLLHLQMCTYGKPTAVPTISFFRNIGRYDEIKGLKLHGLDYDQRLRLGLELTKKEYYRNDSILKQKRTN